MRRYADAAGHVIRLYAYLAAALALLGGLLYVHHIKAQADLVPGLKRSLSDEKRDRANDVAQMEASLAKSEAERKQFATAMQSIADRFNQPLPPPKTLIREVKVPNEPCPRIRVSADFVGLWNNASSP